MRRAVVAHEALRSSTDAMAFIALQRAISAEADDDGTADTAPKAPSRRPGTSRVASYRLRTRGPHQNYTQSLSAITRALCGAAQAPS